MRTTKQNQCCIITGESGAGKTESAKHFLQFIAAVSSAQSSSESWIEEQILQADCIFESAGCAATVRNNNSSRFGKYFDIKFAETSGLIKGAVVDTYLLEQSRIVQHSANERNYHAFYRLLAVASADEFKRLGLDPHQNHAFLTTTSSDITSENDEDGWRAMTAAFQVLLFESAEQNAIFEVWAAVIHLGNVIFNPTNGGDGAAGSTISDVASIAALK